MDPEITKMITTFVIQIVGVTFAYWSVGQMPSCTNVTPQLTKRMKRATGAVFIITVLVFISHKHVIQGVYTQLINADLPSMLPTWITCRIALSIYAVANVAALGILIHDTGGSRQSIYIPYLLIIVPLIIMLKAHDTTIVICLVLTFAIFWLCLFCLRNDKFDLTQGREHIYDLHFASITTLCVLFPVAVKVFAM